MACAWFLLHDSLGGSVDPVIVARLKSPNAPVVAAKPASTTVAVAQPASVAPVPAARPLAPVAAAKPPAWIAPVAAARPAAPVAPVADAQRQAPSYSLAAASTKPVVVSRKTVAAPIAVPPPTPVAAAQQHAPSYELASASSTPAVMPRKTVAAPIAVPQQAAASADPVLAMQSTALTRPNVSVAMLDVTSSIPPGTFSMAPPVQALNRFAAPAAPPQATAPQTTAAVITDVARPAPAVRRPVQTASLAPVSAPEVRRAPQNPLIDAKAAKNKVLSNTAVLKIFEKILGKQPDQQPSSTLAFAPPDGGVLSDGESLTTGRTPLIDEFTAVYDISAATVYLPDGTKLEAHSGLGPMKDNPQHADKRMRGVTPPHVYDLKLREALFHGVRAIRLNPIGGDRAIFGRNGILAHTYMLGPRGDSNGCVSFKDYNTFLQAYLRGDIKRMAVVARLD